MVVARLVVILGASWLAGCGTRPADLVLQNGRIVTVDSANPEVQALAIRGQTIVAVGSDEEIQPYVGPATEVIDLDGRLAIPGFIEGHGHFMSLGRSKMILDLTGAANWDEIVAMVAEAVPGTEPGAWILGRGWHQEKWDRVPSPSVEGLPTHRSLSRVSPDNPVFLTHASGHASFANARAMELAGITSESPDPPGGEIVRDARGTPTGALREKAQVPVRDAIARSQAQRSPEEVDADERRAVELANEELLAKGITSFHDAGASFETIDFFRRLADEGKLPVRLYVMVRYASNEEMAEKLPDYRMIGYGEGRLTVRSIKRQVDGALGPHGAWLLEPYMDLPTSTGLNLEPLQDIARTAELAIEHGFQVNTHAIGDRGNREVLDLYERVFQANPDKTDLRWRIEHAQHLHPDEIPRFAQLGVIAAMQGIHCTSDGPWVIKRLGRQRAEEGAYVWRKLMQSGAIVANGSDAPVEDVDPIASFYASVSRRTKDGSAFFPDERMSREEALRSYTLNNAYAAFEEDVKGSLASGKLADIVVLSKDIMTIPEDQIPTAQVVYTIVGGKVLYQHEATGPVVRR
ncbi:MAG: amidohydrolase family protein [Gemmatimonadales bacterium]|nr:amidohydrolase family protein [Gemmatimonadales bacterium]NIN12347.1 amidohydrolase family protein [Gemmatimonadales bacterium]NIN48885.1 amidohydrolase family protein [Gemmatimonadales bacterium]NIP06349.1 amidohydrolase family protein [Gemmatimonadales bacterium]NIR00722.1 amidohydrolase family protein [Gemmatimonadales bacterium]